MFVEIPGLVSCLEDADCPTGQTCQDDLKCE
jgi:Cys-rich repeat protein